MTASRASLSLQTNAHAPLTSLERAALSPATFWVVLALASSLVWMSPRPPMTDLPQHVAQIVHLKALLAGQSLWASEFRINLLTPYLIGYGLAFTLSFLMPVLLAFKVILTATAVAFVVSCRQLRAELNGDPRLDILFIPGFFGFAYDFGLYSFLVAAPVALQMIRVAWRYGEAPTRRDGLLIAAVGCVLLLTHGLMFLFAGLVSGLLLISKPRPLAETARALLPYLLLVLVFTAFVVATRGAPGAAQVSTPEWWYGPFDRFRGMFVFALSGFDSAMLPLTLSMVLAGAFASSIGAWRRLIPVATLAAVMLALPDSAMQTDYLAGRFGMFVLPFAAICCIPAALTRKRARIIQVSTLVFTVACIAAIAIKAKKTLAFKTEAAEFEEILATAEPGRRALSAELIETPGSKAARHASAFLYWATWYEVEKQGLVDFSFANFHPQIVRFKTTATVARSFEPATGFEWRRTSKSDYYFVRRAGRQWPANFISGAPCPLRLVKQTATWGLFEHHACRD